MSGRLDRIGRALGAAETAFAMIASIATFAIMAIVAIDVALRYLFNSPLSWSFDLIAMYLIVAVFFLSLSDTLQTNHHVSVDLLYQYIAPRLRRALQIICLTLTLPLFAVIAWLGAARALEKLQSADVVAGAIPWPTWPGSAMVALGAALILLRMLFRIAAFALAVATDASEAIDTPEADELGLWEVKG